MRLFLVLLMAVSLAPAASAQRTEPDVVFSRFDDAPSTFSSGDDVAVSILPGGGEYASDALRGSITPSGAGGGFAVTRTGAVNASSAESVVFLARPTVRDANASGGRNGVVLDVKLNQGGVESTAFRELAPATGHPLFSIPLSAFRNGVTSPDGSAVSGVIFAFGGVTGPAFTIDVENLGFATSPVAVLNDFDDRHVTNNSYCNFTRAGTGSAGRPTGRPRCPSTAGWACSPSHAAPMLSDGSGRSPRPSAPSIL